MMGRASVWTDSHANVTSIMTVGIALISMLAAYGITFAAGGSSTVFPHLFYIPVLIVALRWGAIAGITTGFVAGILGGPLMPLDADTGLVQLPSHWLTRMAFFIGIGLLSGVLVERMQRQHKQVVSCPRSSVQSL